MKEQRSEGRPAACVEEMRRKLREKREEKNEEHCSNSDNEGNDWGKGERGRCKQTYKT